jgi:hypothetical protein
VSAPGANASPVAASASFSGASSDGTKVFLQTTQRLVGSDLDARIDVYQRSGAATVLVSGRDEAEEAVFSGASADGPHVYYTIPLRASGHIFEYVAGAIRRAAPDAADTSFRNAEFKAVSPDGSRMFFETRLSETSEFVVYERSGGTTRLVSDTSQLRPGGDLEYRWAGFAGASHDGSRVFFRRDVVKVEINNSAGGMWLGRATFERVNGTTRRATSSHLDVLTGWSADGTRKFIQSSRRLLLEDTDDRQDVYETFNAGRKLGVVTRLVSASAQPSAGRPATDAVFRGASADGSRVFFETTERLVFADTDDKVDVYERFGGTTRLVSGSGGGAAGASYGAGHVGSSKDGTRVFFSTRQRLLGDDPDELKDIYEYSGGQTALVSGSGAGATGTQYDALFKDVSSDGARVEDRRRRRVLNLTQRTGRVLRRHHEGGARHLRRSLCRDRGLPSWRRLMSATAPRTPPRRPGRWGRSARHRPAW